MTSNTPMSPDTTIALMKASSMGAGDAANKIKTARQLEKVAGAAEEFEAIFVAEMMKPMFEGISTDSMFGGGKGEEIFRGMLLQEYGKMMAKTGSVGIADAVKQELIKTQEQK